jgi:hypothetical protein
MAISRFTTDVLAERHAKRRPTQRVTAEIGLVVETNEMRDGQLDGFVGEIIAIEPHGVRLRGRGGTERMLPWSEAGFAIDGQVVTLVRPTEHQRGATRTASGSVAVTPGTRARVARASRILVEGVHDADVLRIVWQADLAAAGVVVEMLDGADNLPDIVAEFAPSADARLGVLLDHLVPGSKESRIASAVSGPHVLVVGHPYVDIWQAVRPQVLGIAAWPQVPRGLPWKETVASALGYPDATTAWREIRKAIRTYRDLDPALLGPVEQLIDFVTAEDYQP